MKNKDCISQVIKAWKPIEPSWIDSEGYDFENL